MSAVVDLAIRRLKDEEGFRNHPYTDTLGNLTVGYGFAVQSGLSELAALALLTAQVTEIQQTLQGYWWWSKLDDVRAAVILDQGFNLGIHGLLNFVNELAAIGKQDWQTASAEMLDSVAAQQDSVRYKAMAQTLLTGIP